jgi:hypothetical protein
VSPFKRNQGKGEESMRSKESRAVGRSAHRAQKKSPPVKGISPESLRGMSLSFKHPDNPNITQGWLTITPEIAQSILRHNTANRDLKKRNSATINRAMVTGYWNDENPDPIVFNEEGFLDNGQHRLTQVVETGTTIVALVVIGVSSSVMGTLDQAAPRSLADRLTVEEKRTGRSFRNKDKISAVVTGLMLYDSKPDLSVITNSGSGFPINEQYDYFISKAEYVDELVAWSRTMNKKAKPFRNLLTVRRAAIFRYALEQGGANAEDIHEFFDGLVGMTVPAQPVLKLRDKLESLQTQQEKGLRLPPRYTFAFLIKGWNAFLSGSEVKQFRWSPGGKSQDQFPELVFTLE